VGRYLDLFDRLGGPDETPAKAEQMVTTKTIETTKANLNGNKSDHSPTNGRLWSFMSSMSWVGTRCEEDEARAGAEASEGAATLPYGPTTNTTETTQRGHPTGTEALTDGFGPAISRWGDAEEERAAIVQFDGNILRVWAEGFARLRPDRPPRGVPAQRWLRFVDDTGLFLDSPFCVSAAAFGWGPYDLFGCDRDRPVARINHLGLLWLLDGGRIMALTDNIATIKTSSGSILTYRRRAGNEPSRVLAWELQ
jgi:hypothetical protein